MANNVPLDTLWFVSALGLSGETTDLVIEVLVTLTILLLAVIVRGRYNGSYHLNNLERLAKRHFNHSTGDQHRFSHGVKGTTGRKETNKDTDATPPDSGGSNTED